MRAGRVERRYRGGLLLLLSCATLLCLCATARASTVDGSVSFQVDPAHDGLLSGDSMRPPLTRLWTRDVGGAGYSVVADGRVFALGSAQNHSILYALDARNGATLWSQDLGGWTLSGPAFDNGRVFTVTNMGIVEAFAADSGTRLWTDQLTGNSSVSAPPTAAQGVLYVGGANTGGTLFAIDDASGRPLWSQPVMNGDSSAPAVDGSRVLVSYVGPQVYAFDAAHGTSAWHYSGCCDGGDGWAPAVYDGRVYTRDLTYGNHVLDAATGHELGSFDAKLAPAFSGSTGLFLSDSTLTARDTRSGVALWTFDGDGALDTPPIVINGTVYVGSADEWDVGHLYAVDVDSGKPVWSDALPAGARGSDERAGNFGALSAGDGILLVPTVDGTIVAYAGTGEQAPGTGQSPPTAGDQPPGAASGPAAGGASSSQAPSDTRDAAVRRALAKWVPILRRDARRVVKAVHRHEPATRVGRAVALMRRDLSRLSRALEGGGGSAPTQRRVARIRSAIRVERRALDTIARGARGAVRALTRAAAAL